MTDLATTINIQPADELGTATGAVATTPMQPTTLITESEVLIGSAAALAGPTVRRHRIRDAVRAMFVATEKAETPETFKTPKHYPRRYGFIEDAAMSRMMDRL